MFLLSESDAQRLIKRRHLPQWATAWESLEKAATASANLPVPDAGVAGWSHNYFCPQHHAVLTFDAARPHEHRCSMGGEMLTDDIYDAAWWRKINQSHATGVQAAGLLSLTDEKWAENARLVLLKYAERYPGYAVHGGIPFNGPGKANCQTLDEANWIIPLALGYDILRGLNVFNEAERRLIEQNLFRACADFLVENRETQLHNHQCWISAAIGTLGLLLADEKLLEVALHARWGLMEQLEQGVLADGFWLEGTVTYHYYAFDALVAFARYPTANLRQHSALRKMPGAGLRLLLDGNQFPLLNDSTPSLAFTAITTPGKLNFSSLGQFASRFELGLAWYGEPLYAWALNEIYREQPRSSLEALLYGVDEINAATKPDWLNDDYSSAANGLTVLRRSAARAGLTHLLLKHNPAGGEHDHFDRPGLYFGTAENPGLATDLGTVPYGLPLHYGFFKNTLTHNTVTLDETNQPPCESRLVELCETPHGMLASLRCDFTAETDTAYRNAVYRRLVLAGDGYLLDVFAVDAKQAAKMEYSFHWQAEIETPEMLSVGTLPSKMPYSYLENVRELSPDLAKRTDWTSGAERWRIWTAPQTGEIYRTALGPANPFLAREKLSFWLIEAQGSRHCFVQLFEWVGDKSTILTDFQIERMAEGLNIRLSRAESEIVMNVDGLDDPNTNLEVA
jgi:hypothetical protein